MSKRIVIVALSVACGRSPKSVNTPPAQPQTQHRAAAVRDLRSFYSDPWLVRNPAEDQMLEWVEAMCECREKTCADQVHAAMLRWSAEQKAIADAGKQNPPAASAAVIPPAVTAASDDLPDPVTYTRMQKIGDRYGECMALVIYPATSSH